MSATTTHEASMDSDGKSMKPITASLAGAVTLAVRPLSEVAPQEAEIEWLQPKEPAEASLTFTELDGMLC